jgi:hypothetical protein
MLTLRDSDLRDVIQLLVEDIAAGRYHLLEADGRIGRLRAEHLQEVVANYGRTIVSLPDVGWGLVDEYPIDGHPNEVSLDIPLWTTEEGRSDLTLSVSCRRYGQTVSVAIDDLRVF